MPILSQDPLNPQEQTRTVSTTGEVVGARFQEEWESGVTSNFFTNFELDADESGLQQSGASQARFGYLPNANRAPGERWTQAEATQQVKEAGLELSIPANGIGRKSLQILMDRKNEELKRQTIYQQAEGGFWQNSAGLGSSFAGMLVDPVNIAVAFVPVVGEARYARWLSQAGSLWGRTGIRAGVGTLEGTAGFVPVEAYNYATKQRLQADYDVYDSLLSVAGGAFFGGALHAGAGFLGDTAGRALGLEPEWVRLAQERNRARAQDVFTPEQINAPPEIKTVPRGLEVDLEARDRAILNDRLAQGRPLTREAATDQALLNLKADLKAELLAQASGRADPGIVASTKAELVSLTQELASLDERALARQINERPGITRKRAETLAKEEVQQRRLDLEARKARAESILAGNKAGSDAALMLSKLEKGEIPPELQARVTAEADRLLGSSGEQPLTASIREALANDPYSHIRPVIAKFKPETQAAALRMAIAQAAMGRNIDVTPALLGDPMFSSLDVGPMILERSRPVPMESPMVPRETFKGELIDEAREIVKNEEADLMLRSQQAGTKVDSTATDELMAEAKSAGKAAQAAALCLMRTGG